MIDFTTANIAVEADSSKMAYRARRPVNFGAYRLETQNPANRAGKKIALIATCSKEKLLTSTSATIETQAPKAKNIAKVARITAPG